MQLTAQQRRKLPDSSFAYIDSEGNRHLPIHDEAHVRAAMSRWSQTAFESADAKAAARRKIRAAAQQFGIDPASFSEEGEVPPNVIAFDASALDAPADISSDYVMRPARLFEAGDYPKKGVSITPDDIEAAVAAFSPVPLRLGHETLMHSAARMPRALAGKLGNLTRVFTTDEGRTLMGEVQLPRWLDSLLDESSRKVSTEWDIATKRLIGLALVEQPAIASATLMAAFSAAQPPEDKPSVPHRRKRMGLRDIFRSFAEERGVEYDEAEAEALFSAASPADVEAKLAERDAKIAELEKRDAERVASFAADKRHADAVTFANSLVDSHRLTPGAAEALVPLVARVFAADATATFADGESTGVALLQAFVATLPDLSVFTTQQVQGTAAFAAGQGTTTPGVDGKPAAPSEDRIKELLSLTPLGRELSNGASH